MYEWLPLIWELGEIVIIWHCLGVASYSLNSHFKFWNTNLHNMYDLLTVKIKPLSRIPYPGERERAWGRGWEGGNLALVRKCQKPRGGSKIFLEDAQGSSEC